MKNRDGLTNGKAEWSWQDRKARRAGIYEDCEFYRVPKEDGKDGFRTVSVYKGVYYECGQTPEEKRSYRFKFTLFYLLLTGFFLFAVSRPYEVNRVWYIGLLEGLMLTSLVYVLVVWILYLTAEKRMRAYLYRMTSRRLIRACEITVLAAAATAILALVSIPMGGFSGVARTLLLTVCMVLCGFAAWGLSRYEASVPYKITQSEEQPPVNGERLDYKTGKR